MYHIFVLIALMASQNQIDKAAKHANKDSSKKAEQLIPSYPAQPNGDILDQFKKELAKEDEAVNKMAKEDLESFGLDDVSDDPNDGDFLNTTDKSNKKSDQKKNTDTKIAKNEATLTGNESDENPPPELPEPSKITAPKTELAQKKDLPTPEPKIVSEPKPDLEVKKAEEVIKDQVKTNVAEEKKDKSVIKTVLEKPKELLNKVLNKTDQQSDKKSSEKKDTKLAKEDSKTTDTEVHEKKPVAKKKSRKEILKEKYLARLKAAEDAREEKKLKKLEALRKQYLVEFDAETDEQNLALDEFQRISSIIPAKKLEPKIIDVEVPFQLLDRNRSNDNKYHPIIPSYKERINFMFKAIAQGRVDDFNALFDTINQPNLQNSQGDTLLTFSILMQKHGAISSLLTKGANPNLSNRLLYKPMNLAIELADYKSIFLLAGMGADINFVDELGRTYLMQAARVGSLPIVDLLISKGVDLNKEDKNGMTALGIAYRYNKDIIVKYLLKKGARTWIPKNSIEKKKSLIEELEHRWD